MSHTAGRTPSLKHDPRADPRLVAALEPFGLADAQPAPPVTTGSSLEDQLAYCMALEEGFQTVFGPLAEQMPLVDGVRTERLAIRSREGAEIELHVHRPDGESSPLPCVVHLHGGGMVMLRAADPVYRRWREALAAQGLLVIGVEFRNGGGMLGPHPYPAGLHDCIDATRWVAQNLSQLSASHLIVSGESGGGNLALSVVHVAKREGWLGDIAGVYAQCPFISDAWDDPPDDLPSLIENDGVLLNRRFFSVAARVYDRGASHAADPTCWPLKALNDDLRGLPPHVVSVNELDPLRDEGLAYYRALCRAGVPSVGRIVAGTCHAGDILVGGAIPEVQAATLRGVAGFARAVSP